ncbi:hydantoinase/oxoprolinase family protein [Conexibacter sp. JD483]|uniref:hydantoinase/oxoprolinase family protein n=1 Tax=unclassified Conexibacter TaxID=2627773 RepID=UPI00271BB892|nr:MULTISPECIES: hydantoinase/oxoprolinase family protein [unclassified Conexibacter]MDO8187799.1 hydantoinase/oxoprolinase family protein [Conexibacter sp. CPCC 205706]MDO8199992.1 hydantoinase/oxoprolinase family protein [Conexibacter sp. CPCC 205762]MDR9369519.1 hydantoinase/oxoprolinase family protein [Conexibacter sp. JD483]
MSNSVGNGNGTAPSAFIGVDVGGTHTDVSVVYDGRVERGKALTTYDDFSRGVLEAVGVAAGNYELGMEELLRRTQLFINGTTVVTNTITTLRGSRVGVLITSGFRDAFRLAGGPRTTEIDDHLQVNVPDLVQRRAIAEIDERVNWAGEVLVPLDVEQVKAQARYLVEEVGVDALAVCFLWSHANEAHELAAEAAIKEVYPDLFVTPSHRVFPVEGETRRWTTAILNSFVQDRAEVYLTSLNERLRSAGLGGGLAFFQGLGGGISLEKARQYPLGLLGSGPAGGALGANELAKRMGKRRVLLGDMGGTSFDTGIISDNEIHIDKNLQLGPFMTGVNIVDVISVGAGGGSIGWVSERGVPQVGPQSAGSTPGPAALGRGGEQPTVTDAMVTLGFIDPDNYLGGRVQLRPELARAALDGTFGERFGWSTEQAAAAIHDLVVVNMANAVREVSVGKGHDPRDFLFLAYGGTLPLFASQIAERLSIDTIVIPQNSSVFCALGLLSSDYVTRNDQGVNWDLSKPDGVERVNAIAARMVEEAIAQMESEGFARDQIDVQRSADLRFQGQAYELTLPMPARPLTADDASAIFDDFLAHYERTYGEGTAWKGVPASLINYSVTVTGRGERPQLGAVAAAGEAAGELVRETREVFLPAERRRERIPVIDDARFVVGARVEGPAIIDAVDTTIYVPPGTTAVRDEHMNYVLTR